MEVTTIPWEKNHPDVALRWIELRRSNPALWSPYFHPKFTDIVSQVLRNVEVAVVGDFNGTAALFPFQRLPGNVGVPVGHCLSDYHGLICAPGFECDPRALVKQCGLIAWDFDHLITSQTSFAPFYESIDPSPQIDLSGGFETYFQGQRGLKTEPIKSRRLERDHGPLRFIPHSVDRAALSCLLRWKSQQYQRTGKEDIFRDARIRSIVQEIHETQDKHFSGMLSLLYAGDRLVAAHLGMRGGHIWHYWFPAFDPELSYYSPGSLLLLKMAEHAPAAGIKTIDLGKGMYEQKRRFMNASIPVASGRVELLSLRYVRHVLRRNFISRPKRWLNRCT
jgi:CelD/BcsL family acetyltransferase involved in cellulose biosynthesis